MSMKGRGLVKLVEECGEVVQVSAKMLAYPQLQLEYEVLHPDGTLLRERLESELGDLLAAVEFVTAKLALSRTSVDERRAQKLKLFHRWDSEP